MRAYGSVAAPIGHTTHVPTGTRRSGGDPFQQLERAHARVSPIRQAPAVDPDAVARLKRLGILVETEPKVLVRTPTKAAKARRRPRQQRPRGPRIDVTALVDAYRAGATLAEAAGQVGCTLTTARKHLRAAGIEPRDGRKTSRKTPPAETLTARRDRLILELHAQGQPVDAIAEATRLQRQTVRRHLVAAGIDVPNQPRGPKPTFDVALAITQAGQGMTVTQIANHHGVSVRAVFGQFRRRGVTTVDGKHLEAMRRGQHIDTDQIVRAYTSGATIPAIAAQLGCGPATVRRRLIRAGVTMRDDRHTNSGGRNQIPDQTVQAAIELYQTGLTGKQVAHRLGIGQTTVGRILREHGVTLRTAARAQTGRPGRDHARGLKDLMAANGITTQDVHAWARRTDRPIPDGGIPGRHLVEDYLLQHRNPTHTKENPA